MQMTCYICGEKGHDARRHFIPSDLEQERVRVAQERVRREIEERKSRVVARNKPLIRETGRKQSQCSICGSFEHTKMRHGKPSRSETVHGTRDNHRCSICGEFGHHANWHKQEEVKAMTEKVCRYCGRLLPIANFDKSLETYKNGGQQYIYYAPVCKECNRLRSGRKESLPNSNNEQKREGPITAYSLNLALNRAKSRAAESKYDFDISLNYLEELYGQQNGKCYYSGQKMTVRGPHVISIDRVDSSRGYARDYVVLCCADVNYLKNSSDVDDFINLCGAIWKHSHKEDQHPKE